ncbi:haloacid dehalogenase-like hydrolase domain-containing protein 2 [Anopheles cruzii]|uniref:haloacid dehalogenase-like hydrolase domain-containing protein 2 n=1 Tax=Anopheles cruzii TaxID=68878 RepID=UPI0022EC5088|nr:haloacid dehalogenase-like hydrolase domain-containing protein 2 [Anopheles cruzii]XP_052862878.1 haloacid dehalogenase-like hydrolase domain-containing protein 2 [Anopheles cruzii]
MEPIKMALIDLSGTLHVDDQPTDGAVEALKRLRQHGVGVKFVTNTTKESAGSLYTRLRRIGFELEREEIYGSLAAASDYIRTHHLNPYYLLTEDARGDMPPPQPDLPHDSVVVGLAPGHFCYERLNEAFRVLHRPPGTRAAQLVAIHEGRYYKAADGIALGPGCFVKGLAYSSGVTPVCIGKPNEYFFRSALPEGVAVGECVMIGDDPNDDCLGAMQIGMRGFLVETGKYQPERHSADKRPAVSGIFATFRDVVQHIIDGQPPARP